MILKKDKENKVMCTVISKEREGEVMWGIWHGKIAKVRLRVFNLMKVKKKPKRYLFSSFVLILSRLNVVDCVINKILIQ